VVDAHPEVGPLTALICVCQRPDLNPCDEGGDASVFAEFDKAT
jgi:hypothetical protein